MEAEEEHPDNNQFDQLNESQLDHDATTLKNLRMDGSSSSSESGRWRREGGGRVEEQGVVTPICAILRAGHHCKTHLLQFVTKKSRTLSIQY